MWKKENSEQGKYESRPNKGRKLNLNVNVLSRKTEKHGQK